MFLALRITLGYLSHVRLVNNVEGILDSLPVIGKELADPGPFWRIKREPFLLGLLECVVDDPLVRIVREHVFSERLNGLVECARMALYPNVFTVTVDGESHGLHSLW